MTSHFSLRTLRTQTLLTLSVLVLILLGSLIVISINELNAQTASTQADQSRQLQLDQATFLTALVDQESGSRGFFNTKQSQFLEPYTLGLASATVARQRLDTAVSSSDRPALQREESSASLWQAWAAARILTTTAPNAPPFDPAQSVIGKQLFDTFRADATAFDNRLDANATLGLTNVQLTSRNVLASALLSALLTLFAFSFLALLILRSTLLPLRRLAFAATALASGRPAEIVVSKSGNELSTLASALASWQSAQASRLLLLTTATQLSDLTELPEILAFGAQSLRQALDCPHVIISLADPDGLRIALAPLSPVIAPLSPVIAPLSPVIAPGLLLDDSSSPTSRVFASRFSPTSVTPLGIPPSLLSSRPTSLAPPSSFPCSLAATSASSPASARPTNPPSLPLISTTPSSSPLLWPPPFASTCSSPTSAPLLLL